MNTQEKINELYKDLIAKFGHKTIQRDNLNEELTKLKIQISELDKLVPFIKQITQE